MVSLQGLAEHLRKTVKPFLRVLNAIDQVVGIFPLEALIEGESLQAGETHQIGVFDFLDGNSRTPEELCPDLHGLVEIKDDGRMRYVERGDTPLSGQGLNPATSNLRGIRKQFHHHQCTVFGPCLPPP